MPNPQNPAVAGLQTAMAPEELIRQRQGVNQVMSGHGMATPPPPAKPSQFQMNPQLPDPSGMISALKQSGYTGQRMHDINLPDESTVDQLRQRIDALMGGGR